MSKSLDQVFSEIKEDRGNGKGLVTEAERLESGGERRWVSQEKHRAVTAIMDEENRRWIADPFIELFDRDYVEIDVEAVEIRTDTPSYRMEITYVIEDLSRYVDDASLNLKAIPTGHERSVGLENMSLVCSGEMRGRLSDYLWKRVAYNGSEYSEVERTNERRLERLES